MCSTLDYARRGDALNSRCTPNRTSYLLSCVKDKGNYSLATPLKEVVGSCLLFLFLDLDLEDRASFVITASRTDTMRNDRLMDPHRFTLRTRGCLRMSHHIMSAAFTRTGIGMTAFWIRHKFPLSIEWFVYSSPLQLQFSSFRFAPQNAHKPLQLGLQRIRIGCSRMISSLTSWSIVTESRPLIS